MQKLKKTLKNKEAKLHKVGYKKLFLLQLVKHLTEHVLLSSNVGKNDLLVVMYRSIAQEYILLANKNVKMYC